ncbi:acyl-CoA dehydrogenase family protein [Mycobacterium genavense]|uniref:acyl-CoA dehydrogenase family protein n=1 Tax=Mycobacterium genavense TaxID=36812 RepID=UPI00046FD871|nr:acyl-CoA dehydrogenase family protein [Mycobacterium genavense]
MTTLSADESNDLAKSIRAVCERLATEQRVREIAFEQGGFDAELWKTLCTDIGVTAIALPERLGGTALGATALGSVAHELGRTLAPVPFVSSAVLATGLLLDLGDDARVAALADSSLTAAAVITRDGGAWLPGAVAVRARRRGAWILDGIARHVLGAAAADELVVVATTDDVPAIFTVDSHSDGVTIEPERVLDATRPTATVRLEGAVGSSLTGSRPAGDVISDNVRRATAVLTAEQVGAHERVLEIATEYARTRTQFGRAIGSFQAVKHRCADILVDLEWARSASLAALQAVDADSPDAGWLTSLAKAVCSEGLRDASHANLQIHGGVRFTWEHSAHLYLKRARTDEVLFGGPAMHWDRIAGAAKLV